jgi:hypothetical protein
MTWVCEEMQPTQPVQLSKKAVVFKDAFLLFVQIANFVFFKKLKPFR